MMKFQLSRSLISLFSAVVVAVLLASISPVRAAEDLGPITAQEKTPQGPILIAYGGLKKAVTYADYRTFGHEDEGDPCDSPDAMTNPEMIECRIDFQKPVISPDRRTLAWLVTPTDIAFKYGGGAQLVIYRNGVIVDVVSGSPTIRDFKYVDRGMQISIAEAPLQGEVTKYSLYDLVYHRRIAEFPSKDANDVFYPKASLPTWARILSIWGEGR